MRGLKACFGDLWGVGLGVAWFRAADGSSLPCGRFCKLWFLYIYIYIGYPKRAHNLENPSPRPELFSSPSLLLAHPWSAQPQSVPGVPNSRVFLECPTPESPGVPDPRVSPECQTPESPWSAKPQSVTELPAPAPESPTPESPGVPNPRSAQPQSLPGVPNPRVSLPERVGMFEVK